MSINHVTYLVFTGKDPLFTYTHYPLSDSGAATKMIGATSLEGNIYLFGKWLDYFTGNLDDRDLWRVKIRPRGMGIKLDLTGMDWEIIFTLEPGDSDSPGLVFECDWYSMVC